MELNRHYLRVECVNQAMMNIKKDREQKEQPKPDPKGFEEIMRREMKK